MTERAIFRPPCPNCEGKGGFMSGYYEPEFLGCECCNPDENNEDDPIRVWRWHWWLFRFQQWREARRLDRWIDEQVAAMERAHGEEASAKED